MVSLRSFYIIKAAEIIIKISAASQNINNKFKYVFQYLK